MIKKRRVVSKPLGKQVQQRVNKPVSKKTHDGDFNMVVSTGSTLLDLCISGGRVHGGGIPTKILVEAFGPSGSGKTVLLSEMAGDVQRKGGNVMFHDPEARLNKQFARTFDLKPEEMQYDTPDKIPQVFQAVRKWDVPPNKINGVFTDSLAALSTDMEMGSDEGDKMGMRRAKEFSEELRRTCRLFPTKNILMVASNQVRVNQNAGPYGQKYISPGGEAIGFYASLRLRFSTPTKIKRAVNIKGKKYERVVGIETEVEVYKSSIWKPYGKAPLIIYFDYGIDDIRANLKYVKAMTKETVYMVNNTKCDGRSEDDAIHFVEENNMEVELKEQVITLWEGLENKFEIERKKKMR